MEYHSKQIPICGNNSGCLGEIQMVQSSQLPVCISSSVNWVNLHKTWMSNMNFLCEYTIVIPWLRCLFSMAKAVLSAFKQVNSVPSDSGNSFNFVIWTFARKCIPIELSSCSDEWQRTWCQTIHMMPGLPMASLRQWKENCNEGVVLQYFHRQRHFEPTFIETHQARRMNCKVRSHKSRIQRGSWPENIISSCNEDITVFESNIAEGIWKLGHWSWETVNSYVIVKKTAGSWILTVQLQAKKHQIWERLHV